MPAKTPVFVDLGGALEHGFRDRAYYSRHTLQRKGNMHTAFAAARGSSSRGLAMVFFKHSIKTAYPAQSRARREHCGLGQRT